MDIKARIDGLTEQEAKAALAWAINKAQIYGSCFDCPIDGECLDIKKGSDHCDMVYLEAALKEARK